MTTDMVQMNTRISRSLKERGDAALERADYMPSQAVRKLWDYAAKNAHNPRAIQNLFDVEDEAEKREAEEERAAARNHDQGCEHRRRCVRAVYLTANAFKRDLRDENGRLTERDAAAATEIGWGCVGSMRQQATAVGSDESDLWTACDLRNHHNDLEDNLIVAAAQRSNATYLVTSDELLIKHAPVAALTLLQANMA